MRQDHGDLAMRWLLASLTVLFLAAAGGYAIVRGRAGEAARVEVPDAFWVASALLLAGGWSLRRALRPVAAGLALPRRGPLVVALVLALAFLLVQAPALAALLAAHRDARAAGLHLYGLVVFLVALHAAHVMGGLVPLAIAAGRRAERIEPAGLRRLGLYWRFLELVWLALFALFLLLG